MSNFGSSKTFCDEYRLSEPGAPRFYFAIMVDMPNSVTYITWTRIFDSLSGMWFGVTPRMDTKRHVLKKY